MSMGRNKGLRDADVSPLGDGYVNLHNIVRQIYKSTQHNDAFVNLRKYRNRVCF